MKNLLISEAIAFVRAAIDELQPNGSIFETASDSDSLDLDHIIRSNILQAVTNIHSTAPLSILGKDAQGATLDNATASDKVLSIPFPDGILRLVALKATDSAITVTELIPEDSEEAAKQNDPYVCGTYQRPVAVLRYYADNPVIDYYSLRTVPQGSAPSMIAKLLYMPIPAFVGADENESVPINKYLENAIINQLTGLVLMSYKDDNAQNFFTLSKAQMQ
jgi:hypothetical protein